jgi:hypothetical protein
VDDGVSVDVIGHLPFELGVAAFQVVAHLVGLDVLVAVNLAHRALDQESETLVARRRPVLARMARQKSSTAAPALISRLMSRARALGR